ncbi:hypothetical protein GN244_ATG12807 [Phytophthora infestans]|uniref:Uncharacterized protein n=1 Tax=Phytophthora infestans TaxID=4787 RepID=A0A833S733_PHYIN|nr:hypothetical protein GN244_ATG12807 [Phytophthora infestans]
MNSSDLDLLDGVGDVTLSDIVALFGALENDISHKYHDEATRRDHITTFKPQVSSRTRPRAKKSSSKPPKKRKHKPGYSTQLLHRRKAEAVNLTRQIPILEEWLGRIKNPHAVDDKRETSTQQQKQDVKSWATTALEEFRRRRTAETINRNLKAAQAVCIKLGKAMLGVIKKNLR